MFDLCTGHDEKLAEECRKKAREYNFMAKFYQLDSDAQKCMAALINQIHKNNRNNKGENMSKEAVVVDRGLTSSLVSEIYKGNPNESVIVYGPAMCGKTVNRQKLAAFYGVKFIFEDVRPGMELPSKNALILMQEVPDSHESIMAIKYGEAIKNIKHPIK